MEHVVVDRSHEGDTSWERALEAVRSTVRVPSALSTLIRGSWRGLLGPKDFMRLLGFPGCNSAVLLRAAQLGSARETPEAAEVEAAVEALGVRASAVTLAINFVCQSVLEAAPPDRVWAPVLKDLMSEVEVGYHFGLGAQGFSAEQGMLVGFSQWAGIAVLLGTHPREFAAWFEAKEGSCPRSETLSSFGCEAYQAGSLVLQQLGFGPDVATAAAIAVGDLQAGLVDLRPEVATWRAAHRWVSALHSGERYPLSPEAQAEFPQLMPPVMCELGRDALPAHLTMLYESVNRVRETRSEWTWHLPKATYEECARELAKSRTTHAYTTSRAATAIAR